MPEQQEGGLPPLPAPNPPIDKQTRIDALMGLSTQFGRQDKIPLDELTKIGYQRIELPEGGTKLRPLDYTPPPPELRHGWAEKLQNVPFGETPVKYSGSETIFRFLGEAAIPDTRIKMDRLDLRHHYDSQHDFDPSKLLGELDETSPFIVFHRDFVQFIQSDMKEREGNVDGISDEESHPLSPEHIDDWIFKWFSTVLVIGHVSDRLNITPLYDYLENDDERGRVLTREKSKELFEDLERAYGIVDDVSDIEKDLDKGLQETMYQEEYEEYPELIDYSKKHDIQTPYQFITHHFSNYLQHIGQGELAAKLGTSKNLQEARALFQDTTFAQSLVGQEKELRQQIKAASIEEKRALSGQMKSIAEQKKKLQQIQFGMQLFFSMPEYLSGLHHKVVKEAQDTLVAGKGKEQQTGFLYLDATPDDKLDADPGKMSGDCTQGKPLPFERPEMPVYNVKVRDDNKKHIGNMYLLVTKELSGHDVWHFDAIQVPKSTVDWEMTTAAIIDSISPIAAEKGIEAITVNDEPHHISNYDYVQEGVKAYWEKHGSRITDVDMLEDIESEFSQKEDRYSHFQGTGEAKVLWTKPRAALP